MFYVNRTYPQKTLGKYVLSVGFLEWLDHNELVFLVAYLDTSAFLHYNEKEDYKSTDYASHIKEHLF